jgi:hypothetical protein
MKIICRKLLSKITHNLSQVISAAGPEYMTTMLPLHHNTESSSNVAVVCCSQNEVEGGEDEREVEQKDFQPY